MILLLQLQKDLNVAAGACGCAHVLARVAKAVLCVGWLCWISL
jgi:hypothetical protein